MSYPTLEQYSEAFQHPEHHLQDATLKHGQVRKSNLGLPLALCGGFALTYTITTPRKKYAVRCFHKQSDRLEQRYSAISKTLASLKSHYFLDFEFQPKGIKLGSKFYPIVKMSWAAGETLGEFLSQNYKNAAELQRLSHAIRKLSAYLRDNGIAHGDIQPGNLMVSNSPNMLQLIDYDGMYVEETRSLGSAELGHRNFQHPKRNAHTWDKHLDHFSFISLEIALRSLQAKPDLWRETLSDGDGIVFKANDFADPTSSRTFSNLFSIRPVSDDAKQFATICQASYLSTPSLEEFLARPSVPRQHPASTPTAPSKKAKYLSAFPVLNAADYASCKKQVGSKVELIGMVTEVTQNKTRKGGRPYIFINFGPWRGDMVRINIWSTKFSLLIEKPDSTWVGRWISITGLMEHPYVNKRLGYSHLAISLTEANQIHEITETEAKFRLANETPVANAATSVKSTTDNLRGDIAIKLRITNWLAEQFKDEHGIDLRRDRLALQRLKEAADVARVALQSETKTVVQIPFITADETGPKHLKTAITHADLKQLIEDVQTRIINWLAEGVRLEHGVDLRDDGLALERLKMAAWTTAIKLDTKNEAEVDLPFVLARASGALHIKTRISRENIGYPTLEPTRSPFAGLTLVPPPPTSRNAAVAHGSSNNQAFLQNIVGNSFPSQSNASISTSAPSQPPPINSSTQSSSPQSPVPKPSSTQSNMQIVDAMKNGQQPAVLSTLTSSTPNPTPSSQPSGTTNNTTQTQPQNPKARWCFIATTVYGPDAVETKILRQWRDEKLMVNKWGRLIVAIYYAVSPTIASTIKHVPLMRTITKTALDVIVEHIKSEYRSQQTILKNTLN